MKTEKKKVKEIPQTKNAKGKLLKLKRSDFPYTRNGIIAYCDYRIEYWQLKKVEMLKKEDPAKKLTSKRQKLLDAIKDIDTQIDALKTK